MSESPIRYLGDVRRLSMKPDDVLVVSVDDVLSAYMRGCIEEHVRTIVGADRRIIVLGRGAKVGLLGAND